MARGVPFPPQLPSSVLSENHCLYLSTDNVSRVLDISGTGLNFNVMALWKTPCGARREKIK